MEAPDTLLDFGKAYINDIQRIFPTSGLIIFCLSLTMYVIKTDGYLNTDGIWILAASTSISSIISDDSKIWSRISVADIPISLLCATGAILLCGLFRRIVFWAITSNPKFRNLQRNQIILKAENQENHTEQLSWIKEQAEKGLRQVKSKQLIAELLCGVFITSIWHGSLLATVDIFVEFSALLIAYIITQATAKEYITNAYPYTLLAANLIGLKNNIIDN